MRQCDCLCVAASNLWTTGQTDEGRWTCPNRPWVAWVQPRRPRHADGTVTLSAAVCGRYFDRRTHRHVSMHNAQVFRMPQACDLVPRGAQQRKGLSMNAGGGSVGSGVHDDMTMLGGQDR